MRLHEPLERRTVLLEPRRIGKAPIEKHEARLNRYVGRLGQQPRVRIEQREMRVGLFLGRDVRFAGNLFQESSSTASLGCAPRKFIPG